MLSVSYSGSGRLGIACCQLALLTVIDKAVNWMQCFFVENEKYRTQHGSLRDTDLDTEGDECQPYTIHRVTGTWLYANTARCGRAFEPADSIEGR